MKMKKNGKQGVYPSSGWDNDRDNVLYCTVRRAVKGRKERGTERDSERVGCSERGRAVSEEKEEKEEKSS